MTIYALRISCPDRPGSLGTIATLLGQAGANIVALDVLERTDTAAIDHVLVDAPDSEADGLVAAVEAVPGAVVERIQPVRRSFGTRQPLEVAADLVTAEDDALLALLVDGLVEAFDATWSAVVRERSPQPEVLAASAGAPSFVGATTPWLPLASPRRLSAGEWVPRRWAVDLTACSFAVAPLRHQREAVVLGRARGPLFRSAELRDLAAVARVAAGLLSRSGATRSSSVV